MKDIELFYFYNPIILQSSDGGYPVWYVGRSNERLETAHAIMGERGLVVENRGWMVSGWFQYTEHGRNEYVYCQECKKHYTVREGYA